MLYSTPDPSHVSGALPLELQEGDSRTGKLHAAAGGVNAGLVMRGYQTHTYGLLTMGVLFILVS
jgi:hypothetical protein